MKNYFALLLVLSSAFYSCKKEEDKDPAENQMVYSINGLSNVDYKFAKLSIPIELKHLSGPQEAVTLTVTGFPTGITSKLGTNSGTPTFSTLLDLSSSSYIPKGTYPIKFTSTTNSGKSKSIDFNFIIDKTCAETLLGKYSVTSNIFSHPDCIISSKSDNQNRIYVYDENKAENLFYCDVNCTNGTIIIPDQNYGTSSSTINGTGVYTYNPNYLILNLKLQFPGIGTVDDVMYLTFK